MILLASVDGVSSAARVRRIADRIIAAAAATTDRLGGSVPTDYRVIHPYDPRGTHV